MVVTMSVFLSGCLDATNLGSAQRPSTKTATDRAIGKCVVAVGGGALIGALVGDSKKAALIGAGLGAAACGVMIEVASREDKARLAAAEQAALRADAAATQSFTTTSGKRATVRTSVRPAAKPVPTPDAASATTKPNYTACRYTAQTISVEGNSTTAPRQLWCRVDTGDWQAVSG